VSRAKLRCAVVGAVAALVFPGVFRGADQEPAAKNHAASGARDLFVTVGKSLVVESPVNIQRISIGDAKKAEAMAVTPREVLVNGKDVGETSLIIWQAGGNRLLFDLKIQPSTQKLDTAREELEKELPGQHVKIVQEGDKVFVTGTVGTLSAADRAVAIAESVGKPINLLRVKVPPVEDQILLRVKFANVDRTASLALGLNLASIGGKNIGSVGTQQFSPPTLQQAGGSSSQWNLSDLLNIFLFRPDLNLLATIKALQTKQALEILAEPNLLTINGKPASFLAGGEFPVPVIQPGSGGVGSITIMWKEFGVRINFVPTVTPRKTIRLRVASEVSSLDAANGITISGFAVPAIATKRMQTEVELQDGQSFAIAGLLDNRVIESLNKVPGLSSIPLLGKLFQSKSRNKTNTELLVMVTPEVVRPIPAGQPVPEIKLPLPMLEGAPTEAPRTPPVSVTGPVPMAPGVDSVPVEDLKPKQGQGQQQGTQPQAIQLLTIPTVQPQTNPGTMTEPVPTPSTPTP
jgi:pilus assembly protein CpaC